ncbi:MAG: hypothetical protein QOH25_3823 [Acidobacteriota bacterium]|nr:hypothetical protein [Acidobacteriota bacterium]
MNHCQHFNLIFFDEVNDSVGGFHNLSHFINLVFRHHPPGAREICNSLRTIYKTLNNSSTIIR